MKRVRWFDTGQRRPGVDSGCDIVECEVEKIDVLRNRVVAG